MPQSNKHILLFIKSNYHELLLQKELQSGANDFTVTTVKTKIEVLNLLAQEPIDALVLDLNTGTFEQMCEVHQIHLSLPSLPIIALTDALTEENVERLGMIGVIEYLMKSETCYAAVAEVLTMILSQEILPMKIQKKNCDKNLSEQLKLTSSTLSHEINNPLMTILGISELILDNQDAYDKELIKKIKAIQKSAVRIQKSTHRLTNLTSPVYQKTASGMMVNLQKSRIYTKTKLKLSETE